MNEPSRVGKKEIYKLPETVFVFVSGLWLPN